MLIKEVIGNINIKSIMIKEFKCIDDYLNSTKVGVPKTLDNFLIYSYQDVHPDAQLTQSSYRHHFYELTLDINEGCSYQVDSFNLPLQGKRLSVIAPNRLQSNVVHSDLLEESRGFSIFFEKEFLGTHFNEVFFINDYCILRPDFSPSFELSNKQLEEFSTLFSLIRYEQKEYGNKSKEAIRNFIKIIFEKTKGLNHFPEESCQKSPLVSEFLALSYSSFLRFHTVKEFAKLLSVTPKHLSEAVKAQTGLTALETLQQLKINYAKGLLRQSQLTVKQIAIELGFENSEYFNVFFKRYTGETPGQFRQI